MADKTYFSITTQDDKDIIHGYIPRDGYIEISSGEPNYLGEELTSGQIHIWGKLQTDCSRDLLIIDLSETSQIKVWM